MAFWTMTYSFLSSTSDVLEIHFRALFLFFRAYVDFTQGFKGFLKYLPDCLGAVLHHTESFFVDSLVVAHRLSSSPTRDETHIPRTARWILTGPPGKSPFKGFLCIYFPIAFTMECLLRGLINRFFSE